MKKCVVSFANTPAYLNKMNRMENSLKGNFDGDVLLFTKESEIGCKPHSVVPYQFKPYAIQKAIDLGYELVLWCDSPILAIKNIQPVFDHIEEHGYIFFDNIGHPLGKWSNDKTLDYFGISRARALETKMIMACCMGFNFADKELHDRPADSMTIRELFFNYANLSNELYPGEWSGPQAHRHDQTVMSILLDEYKFNIVTAHETFFMYEAFKDVPEFKIAESVCLKSL